jgi:flavin-binding protein dodecin
MRVVKRNELIGSSPHGFEAAAQEILARANRTLRGVTGLEVLEKKVEVEGSAIAEYHLRVRLVFEMAPDTVLHW